jgi:hypothetical protein
MFYSYYMIFLLLIMFIIYSLYYLLLPLFLGCIYFSDGWGNSGCVKKNGNCSMAKVGSELRCILPGSADICAYYIDSDGCRVSGSGEVCTWNSTIGKCVGIQSDKPCNEYNIFTTCSAVSDRCFWNGAQSSSASGSCLSLEVVYKCADLSLALPKVYNSIGGPTVDDSPCFSNVPSNSSTGNYTSVESVINATCGSIKTDGRVGGMSGPAYCDDALFLFGIKGVNGVGCMWDSPTKSCVDLKNVASLPDSCSGYKSESECSYHLTSKNEKCFWNGNDTPTNGGCVSLENFTNCSAICTNEISGFDTYYCDGNAAFVDSNSEVCQWEGGESGQVHICSCSGVEVKPTCELILSESPANCRKFVSKIGPCFFNGNDQILNGTTCSDINSVDECSFLKDRTLCTYANKYTYPNLEVNSTTSRHIFVCLWNIENGKCDSKKLGFSNVGGDEEGNGELSLQMVIIIIASVGTVAFAIVIIVIILVVKRLKTRKGNRLKEQEMDDVGSSIKIAPGGIFIYYLFDCIFPPFFFPLRNYVSIQFGLNGWRLCYVV